MNNNNNNTIIIIKIEIECFFEVCIFYDADTFLDEYVKTVGKWEGWLFFYLGVIYILKNFSQNQNPLEMAPSSLVMVPSSLIEASL
jgi:hypothetical protein